MARELLRQAAVRPADPRHRRVNAEQRAAFGYETRPFFDGPAQTDLTYIAYSDGRGRIDATFDLTQSAVAFEFAKWSKKPGEPGRGRAGGGDARQAHPRIRCST
jgi:hypothetical protein